jgi:EAL domain-containing protein (putative c-di-GMP-specific phosphodiesterase class I)
LPVLAEGVETEKQLAFLANEYCDEVQGYLIGKPRPIEDYAALLTVLPEQLRRMGERLAPSQTRPPRVA